MSKFVKRKTNRQINAEKTKHLLYKNSIYLFNKYGYDAVTIDDIAEYSNMTKGAFYTHFKSKHSILIEQFSHLDKIYLEKYEQIKHLSNSEKVLRTIVIEVVTALRDVVGLNFLSTIYSRQIDIRYRSESKLLGDLSRPLFSILIEIFNSAKKHGAVNSNLSSEELSSITVRSLRGVIYDWILYNGEFDLIEATEIQITPLLKVFFKQNR